ncbi:Protein of unknown function (DUF3285) [Synechococcus sp. PCC 7502]|uniref:DUF3285 domain-containing protein n=1 Tax=Synechococcus sp. PCC 7502 TaxID=1173263 RepID=UPI00029FA8F7|nr:DUF3285 domain-containing protein [Synechococcus sp. PCC 7502]AFY74697.1 Protein of unknown function (DUF3285) [Synechococcus sp. PCC 7502]
MNIEPDSPTPVTPAPSYVKLAMRNMVKKRGTSIFHFLLTSVGLIAVLVALAVVFR